MNRENIIKNLKKLNDKIPELAKATKEDKFWEQFHPYTIDDAIEYIEEMNCVCDDPSCPKKGQEGEVANHIDRCSCEECHRELGKI